MYKNDPNGCANAIFWSLIVCCFINLRWQSVESVSDLKSLMTPPDIAALSFHTPRSYCYNASSL